MAGSRVAIVGGGLAGLVAGFRLLERGCAVTVFESSSRWGGKAGATEQAGTFEEHGYHIFPAWYRNAMALADELGLRDRFRDCTRFLQLRPGAYPAFRAFTNIASLRWAAHNLFAGVIPIPQAFLFLYAALDLTSQPYRRRAALDQVTVTGFLRSRFYRTEAIARQFEELMLTGISVPTSEVSAMTMRNVMRFWLRAPEPMHRILKGDLQTEWIEPIRRKLESLGGALRLNHKLTRIEVTEGRAKRLHFEGRDPFEEFDSLLMAIPAEKLANLIDDRLYAAAPDLADVRHLRARAMCAFNVYFKRPIADMPPDHVNLLDSRYGLSFIDVAQIWESGGPTALNVIASDFTDLESLSPETAVAALMDDLARYIPFQPEDVARITFQSHVMEPLFMNNAGNWPYRPTGRSQLANLYVAGDFCQSAIDLVSMEGAISTGLRAAEAMRGDLGLSEPIECLVPETPPHWLLALGKVALLPVAALARGLAWFGPEDMPGVAETRPFELEGLPRWPVEVVEESI